MNAINQAVTAVFDALLWPLEQLGRPTALILASAVFGVLALFVFKHVSWQKGIRAAKDKIQAGLIEIRIYQDDLRVASKAIVKVLLRNFVYLGLNLLPFVPLSIPFTFVLAQFVVRYGFAPVEIHAGPTPIVAGGGTWIEVVLDREHDHEVAGLSIEYPAGVEAVSPLVRAGGRAFQEVVARSSGRHEIVVSLASGARETKLLFAGEAGRVMQGERGSGVFHSLLWPAEDGLVGDSPFERITFTYPDSELGWLPGGVGGVLIVFLVASMVAGALAIKPLKVQI